MDQQDEEARRKEASERVRQQLETGTWPEVMQVFGYQNPGAPRTPDEEYARLKKCFEDAKLPNLAAFVSQVQFAEKEHGVAMSFNLSLRARSAGNGDEVGTFFMTPDILVGTRWGEEGAAIWLKLLIEAIPGAVPESVQLFEKIFGEAVAFLSAGTRRVTTEDMIEAAVLGTGPIMEPPDTPSKH